MVVKISAFCWLIYIGVCVYQLYEDMLTQSLMLHFFHSQIPLLLALQTRVYLYGMSELLVHSCTIYTDINLIQLCRGSASTLSMATSMLVLHYALHFRLIHSFSTIIF